MITFSVTNVQQARDAFQQELKKLMTDKAILVGIHEDAEDAGDNFTMAKLGATLHFGNDRIPARPWLDLGVASGSEEYLSVIEENADNLDNALEIVGQMAVAHVQQFMIDLRDPANAESTVKKKGSSNPLIDEGHLKQSVTYSIVSNLPEEGLS